MGCQGDTIVSNSPSSPAPVSDTATVIVRHNLQARPVPATITEFRFTAFDAAGGVVFGPQRVATTAEVTLTLPISAKRLRIEYLQGDTVVGLFEAVLALSPGATTEIDDPDWVDTVTTQVATRLLFSTQPTNAAPNTPMASFAVSLVDADGNVVSTAATPVTLALATNPTGAILSGTLTVEPVDGVARFTDIQLDRGGTYTFAALASGLQSATSEPFTVSQEPLASTLRFVSQPTNVNASATLTPAVTVEVLDQFGNRFSTSANLSLALGSNPGGAALNGTTTQAAVNGLATFADLSLSRPGNGYTLVATGAGLPPQASDPFNVALQPVVAASTTQLNAATAYRSVETGDINGDNRPDIAALQATSVDLYFQLPDGSYPVAPDANVATGGNSYQALLLVDLDGDTQLDMVVSDRNGNRVRAYQNTGVTPFLGGAAVDTAVTNPSGLAVGQLNSTVDNLPDILAARDTFSLTQARVESMINNGAFGFTVTEVNQGGGTGGLRQVALGDFNQDTFTDLISVNNNLLNPLAKVTLGNGDGTYGTTLNLNLTDNLAFDVLSAGDLNQDGLLDLVAGATGNGSVDILLGDGTGGVLQTTAFTRPSLGDIRQFVVADVNGDGLIDLTMPTGSFADTLALLFGNGTGVVFTEGTPVMVGATPVRVSVRDLDGDGKQDFVTANSGPGGLTVVRQ